MVTTVDLCGESEKGKVDMNKSLVTAMLCSTLVLPLVSCGEDESLSLIHI